MNSPGPDPDVSDDELLRMVRLHYEPVTTAQDLVDNLPYSAQNVTNRLNSLAEDGLLRSKQTGGASKVYWLSDAGLDRLAQS